MALISKGGSLATPKQVGKPVYEIPFEGDPVAYIYSIAMKVRAGTYSALPLDTAGPSGGYHIGEGSFKMESGQILSYERRFAFVPVTRSEYESYIYSYVRAQWGGGEPPALSETPILTKSRLQFDYFQTDDPETEITLLQAPRAVIIFDELYFLNGFGTLVVDEEWLAEDDTYRRWHGNIYERVRRYIIGRDLTSGGPEV